MIDGNIKENDFVRTRQTIKKLADSVNSLVAAKAAADSSVVNADTLNGLPASAFLRAGVGGVVQAVEGAAPVVSSGGVRPIVSMPAATASVDGYMTSTFAGYLNQDVKTTASPVFSTVKIGSATGVWATATDGKLTLTGKKATGGLNEDITLDFDNTTQKIIIGSSTGVTEIDIGAINLVAGGIKIGTLTGILTSTSGSAVTTVTKGAHEPDAKTDYAAFDLNTETELITAFNATNATINSLISKLETIGILATS